MPEGEARGEPAGVGSAAADGHERLTDHFNRVGVGDPGERVRLAAIRERVAQVLAKEAGGLRGMVDGAIERPQLTCLVQDVWLKLERAGTWDSRAHFLAAVARAAREVLIDQARKRNLRGERRPLEAHEASDLEIPTAQAERLLHLEALLGELAAEGASGERAARVAGLRLFGGLSCSTIAEVEGVSTRTIERDWRYAQAWLADAAGEGGGSEES